MSEFCRCAFQMDRCVPSRAFASTKSPNRFQNLSWPVNSASPSPNRLLVCQTPARLNQSAHFARRIQLPRLTTRLPRELSQLASSFSSPPPLLDTEQCAHQN